jgi:hypothetical protein
MLSCFEKAAGYIPESLERLDCSLDQQDTAIPND